MFMFFLRTLLRHCFRRIAVILNKLKALWRNISFLLMIVWSFRSISTTATGLLLEWLWVSESKKLHHFVYMWRLKDFSQDLVLWFAWWYRVRENPHSNTYMVARRSNREGKVHNWRIVWWRASFYQRKCRCASTNKFVWLWNSCLHEYVCVDIRCSIFLQTWSSEQVQRDNWNWYSSW